jgi:beta-mannosidase
MSTTPLDGRWQFRAVNPPESLARLGIERWMPCTMPGTVHYQLQKLGKIADPYYGRNELDVQWVDELDWEVRREVSATTEDARRAFQDLVFDGLDTVAAIRLNGTEVGRSKNMFRQVVCDVRGVLRPGKNELVVLLASPTRHAAREAERHRSTAGGRSLFDAHGEFRWQTGETRPTHRVFIRKTQCHFGWDWGVYLATSGIWQPARLYCSDHPRIASVVIAQQHEGPAGAPSRVVLTVKVHLDRPLSAERPGALSIRCGRQNAVVPLERGRPEAEATFTVERPRLWWPAGQGDQPLYELAVRHRGDGDSEEVKRRIGLRTIELVTQPSRDHDDPAESFFFRVNGRPVYAKGANWIPPDQFVERCTPGVYRHLLESMTSAHMNMVRVWGGGWYEQDVFYDLCDELGLMVWQDFMMACALYPASDEFTGELEGEARYQVRRLSHHPSLALFCGDNENREGVARWWSDRDQRLVLYRRLLERLGHVVRAEAPGHRFWLSSPSNDLIDDDDPNDLRRGDVHFWEVWHKKQPFTRYREVAPRFVSEFGFQSFPEPRTILAVVPEGQQNPSSRVMEHHQRSEDGNLLITNTMAREMPIPSGFEAFCRISQINQAMAIRTAVEHWRRLKPWCMGTLYWQLDDLWPVASWSSIDYGGRWKALHHAARRFFAPLLASIVHERDQLTVWATSDLARPLALAGHLEAFTWEGRRIARVPLRAKLDPLASAPVATIEVPKLLGGKAEPHEVCCFVTLAGAGAKSDNFAALVPWKWVGLEKPRLSTKLQKAGEVVQLTVKSEQVVPFFHAELDGLEGHFAGSYDVLRPRREYVLAWMPHRHRGARHVGIREARSRLVTTSLYDMARA